jgi:DNA-binding MurR/RpiR family transcriptional regulator
MEKRLNCYDQILTHYNNLPNLHKRIADFIITNIHEVVFYSIIELANASGISESTIVRFSRKLGYKGFPDFKQELVNYYKEYMKIDGRIRHSIAELPKSRITYEELTRKEISYLENSIRSIHPGSFYQAVRAICDADMTYLFGNDLNISLANDLCFRLSRFKLRASSASLSGHSIFEKLLLITEKDLAIIFDFYKPSVDFRRLMDILREKHVSVILITDTLVPPMVQSANIVLCAERGTLDQFSSQVVPVAISNALVMGVANELGDKAIDALRELSELHANYTFDELEEFSI